MKCIQLILQVNWHSCWGKPTCDPNCLLTSIHTVIYSELAVSSIINLLLQYLLHLHVHILLPKTELKFHLVWEGIPYLDNFFLMFLLHVFEHLIITSVLCCLKSTCF